MFAIVVEMWGQSADDEFDMEYCGEFFWGDGFSTGVVILFDTPQEALIWIMENKMEDKVPGFEYRYRVYKISESENFQESA